jgi:hypothetical protein
MIGFGIIEIANTISKAIDNVGSEKNHEISTQSQ